MIESQGGDFAAHSQYRAASPLAVWPRPQSDHRTTVTVLTAEQRTHLHRNAETSMAWLPRPAWRWRNCTAKPRKPTIRLCPCLSNPKTRYFQSQPHISKTIVSLGPKHTATFDTAPTCSPQYTHRTPFRAYARRLATGASLSLCSGNKSVNEGFPRPLYC